MMPDSNDLWFLPLGGTGEIGMNLNLYGHDGRWLMVDCGVTFPKPGRLAADGSMHHHGEPPVQMADPAFIAERRETLCGLVITHAHEDHVGAVPYLWPLLQCPVYTNRFTAEILRRKLAEFNMLHRVPIVVMETNDRRQIGPFNVQWLALTHSIPDPNALMIRTPVGNIFHSGDWKLDDQPLIGHGYSKQTFTDLAIEGVAAMVCDSTNAMVKGHSVSEGALHKGLLSAVKSAEGRVVVACFGSNIARLHTLAAVARETGRYMGLLGRSLVNMSSAAKAAGLWHSADELINPAHLGYLPPHEVLVVATGSQGEPRTALRRLANGSHPDDLPIHASGHPAQEELEAMYRWVQPAIAIPVHGEEEHMAVHARLAKQIGVPKTLVGRNGDLFMIRPVPGMRRQITETGRLGWLKQALVRVV